METVTEMMTAEKPGARRKAWACVGILLVLWVLMSFWRVKGPIDLRYDGGVYYILGTSLAQGKGYRLLNEPGEIEAVQYPPLLPAIVAAYQLALGTDDIFIVGHALRISYLGFYLALILLSFAYSRRYLGDVGALTVGALTALNYNTYYFSDLLFTEIPFAIVTLLFLFAAERDTRWSTPLSFLLAAAAYLLRTSGIALLAAWIVDAALKRRFRLLALRVGLAAIPVLAWQYYIHQVRNSDEYRTPAYSYQRAPYLFYNVTYGENVSLTDPFRPELGYLTLPQLSKRFVSNLARLPIMLGEGVSISREFWKWPYSLLGRLLGWDLERRTSHTFYLFLRPFLMLIGVLALIGGVATLRSPEPVSALYAGAAIVLILSTPWPKQTGRYLMPLIPILSLALIQGILILAQLSERFFSKWRTVGVKVALALILGPILLFQCATVLLLVRTSHHSVTHRDREGLQHEAAYFYFREPWKGLERAFEWTLKEVPMDSILVSTCPHLDYLRSGFQFIMPPFEADPDRFLELLNEVPVDYVIVDHIKELDITSRYAAPAFQKAPDKWRPVFVDEPGQVTVYKRVGSPEEEDSEGTGSSDKLNSKT